MRLLAIALAVCVLTRPSAAQDTNTVSPGDEVVRGRSLRPYERRYTVYELPCEVGDTSVPRVMGSWRDHLEFLVSGADTALRRVIESATQPAAWLDTVVYDRSTLRPKWSRTHGPGTLFLSYNFHPSRVEWQATRPNGQTDSLSLVLHSPTFLDGGEDLVLQAFTALPDSGKVFKLHSVGIAGEGEEHLEEHDAFVKGLGVSHITRPHVGPRTTRLIMVGTVSEVTYWIDPETREILQWETVQYESACPRRYVLNVPPR